MYFYDQCAQFKQDTTAIKFSPSYKNKSLKLATNKQKKDKKLL